MIYALPGAAGAPVAFKKCYDNFINGKFVPPVSGQYFDVITPINGLVFTQAARSNEADVELALDAAHAASAKWGATSPTERANILLKIADRLEQNLEKLLGKRIDIWATDVLSANYFVKKSNNKDRAPREALDFRRSLGSLACNVKMPKADVAKLQGSLDAMIKDGTVGKLTAF